LWPRTSGREALKPDHSNRNIQHGYLVVFHEFFKSWYTSGMSFIDTFITSHQPKPVIIDGHEKYYVVGGKGKTAFLIFPGSGQDALSCYDLVDEFEKEYKVIAVNYDDIYSVESFFEYIQAILKQERVEKVILYGLSLGGFLAQHYVRRYKESVKFLILSHCGTTKSKTIIRQIVIPGKILYFFIPIIPQKVLNALFKPLAGRVQTGKSHVRKLYHKHASKENLERRYDFARKTTFSFIDKNYIRTLYQIGTDMERLEKNFTSSDLQDWKGKMLILRTDNDPLTQDDGMFLVYYPEASVVTFGITGHLTPFIQFEKMVEEIHHFLQRDE
jgi:pimeloyl-ACP methyl ester carboxylesterase